MNESLAPANGALRWEHFPHGSDVGVRGYGATPAAAFEQAALALTAAVTSARVEASEPVEVSCEAPDLELLFVEWAVTSGRASDGDGASPASARYDIWRQCD